MNNVIVKQNNAKIAIAVSFFISSPPFSPSEKQRSLSSATTYLISETNFYRPQVKH